MMRLPAIEPRSAYIWSGFLQSVAGFGIGTYTFRFLYWVIVIDTTSDIFAFLTTEPNKGGDPPERDAGRSDGAGGDRRLDECTSLGSAQAAKAASRQFAKDCREGG